MQITDHKYIISSRSSKSESALRALAGLSTVRTTEKSRTVSGPPLLSEDLSTPTIDAEVIEK